jgi:hypothetical protein
MRSWLLAVTALGLWATALALFLIPIYPEARALTYPVYEDDGVYVGAAQLLAQGIVPYRDFFFQHPPMGAMAFLPAVLYHFDFWGSSISFALARYWSALTASAAVVFIFVCVYLGTRNWIASLLAATVAMMDSSLGFVARQTLLDMPMVLADLLAIAALMGALNRSPTFACLAAGTLTGVAGLFKLPGLALSAPAALMLGHMHRGKALTYLAALLVTFGAGIGIAILVAGPTVLLQIFAYQALRPPDGTVGLWARMQEFASPLHRQLLVTVAVSPAYMVLSRNHTGQLGQLGLMWSLLLVAFLMLSRSFYPHYLVDVVPAAYLALGATFHTLIRRKFGMLGTVSIAMVLLAAGLQGTLSQLFLGQDRIYVIVSRYISGTTQPDSRVLALNPLFGYLAGRQLPEGWGWKYMLDSYGSMVYTGLGLPLPGEPLQRSPLDAGSRDVWELVKEPRPQMLITSRLGVADLVIIDGVGSGRIARQTAAKLHECFDQVENQTRYTIFRARPNTRDCVVGDSVGPPLHTFLADEAWASRK